jgi:Rrf2 family protein
MLELTHHFGGGPVLMNTLAERQDLSRKYLHRLLTSLKEEGLVRSVRGPGGGFVLSRPPDKIRLGQVLRALEGPTALVDCVTDRRACRRTRKCETRQVWRDLSNAITSLLDSVTLADLVDGRTTGNARRRAAKKKPARRRRASPAGKRTPRGRRKTRSKRTRSR